MRPGPQPRPHNVPMYSPSTIDQQMALWPTQRETRIGLDDDFTVPRPVEHFAYFRRRGAAASAATELQSLGFDVVVERRGLKTMLHATRDEELGDHAVAAFLAVVVPVIEGAKGDYDGWGANVERATHPAPTTQPPATLPPTTPL